MIINADVPFVAASCLEDEVVKRQGHWHECGRSAALARRVPRGEVDHCLSVHRLAVEPKLNHKAMFVECLAVLDPEHNYHCQRRMLARQALHHQAVPLTAQDVQLAAGQMSPIGQHGRREFHVSQRNTCLGYYERVERSRFDVEGLDETDPFEVDSQLIHLYKHQGMDVCDVYEIWTDNPVFYPASEGGPADWLMVGQVPGDILLVPLAPGESPNKTRPIGVYRAGRELDKQYREDSG